MTKKYTVFIGSWDDGDPDWTIVRESGLSWESARDSLAKSLASFADDDCDSCRSDAAEALQRLKDAQPGAAFEAFVDGDDYLIIQEGAHAQ